VPTWLSGSTVSHDYIVLAGGWVRHRYGYFHSEGMILLLPLHCQVLFFRVAVSKEYHTPWRVLVGCSSPLLRPWACRWINPNHLSLWRMASASPDLRLPSQSQDIAAPRLVPNYTAWWQRYVCEQLAQGRYLTAARPGVEIATFRVASQRLNHYTTKKFLFD